MANSQTAKKTIIITGANGNLGTAVTNLFLSRGYTVIATVYSEADLKDLPQHQNLKAEVVDLSKEDLAEAFVQKTIAGFKKIDAALLLVGGFAMGNIIETKSADIKKQFALNFDTAYHVVHP